MKNSGSPKIRGERARFHARVASVLALFASFLLMAGCDNNPYPNEDPLNPTIYSVLADNPKSMDPSVAYDVPASTVIDSIYPAYFKYNYLKHAPFTLELALGAEMPKKEKFKVTFVEGKKTITQEGERWTFKIKPGLRYQDEACFPGGKGREITAADFIYTFKRMADPVINCPIYSFFGDNVIGMADFNAHNAEVEKNNKNLPEGSRITGDYNFPIEGLQTDPADPYTFRIVLKHPYPQLQYLMAMHFTSPIAHEAVDTYGKEFARHPVGCGAYKLEEFKPKSRIVLVTNENRMKETYPSEGDPGDREKGLLEDAGKTLPLANRVQFNIVSEGITSWNSFIQGYQDAATITQSNYEQAIGSGTGKLTPEMEKKGINLTHFPQTDTWYYLFNMEDPIVGNTGDPAHDLKSKKLRQAISLSIDSQQEIDLLTLGIGIKAQSLIPPGLFGYDAEFKNPYREANLEKAKQLLAEAGYKDGIDPKTGEKMVLAWENAQTTPAGRQLIGLLTKQIELLGIKVDSRSSLFPIFQDHIDKGSFQFADWGWVADYPDPENFDFLFYGPNKRPGPNHAAYNNPAYDKIFDKMQSMEDGPERLKLIQELREIITEDSALIPRYHTESLVLTHQWLHNYKPNPVSLDLLKYRRVDGVVRQKLRREWNAPSYAPIALGILLLVVAILPGIKVARDRSRRMVRKNGGGA